MRPGGGLGERVRCLRRRKDHTGAGPQRVQDPRHEEEGVRRRSQNRDPLARQGHPGQRLQPVQLDPQRLTGAADRLGPARGPRRELHEAVAGTRGPPPAPAPYQNLALPGEHVLTAPRTAEGDDELRGTQLQQRLPLRLAQPRLQEHHLRVQRPQREQRPQLGEARCAVQGDGGAGPDSVTAKNVRQPFRLGAQDGRADLRAGRAGVRPYVAPRAVHEPLRTPPGLLRHPYLPHCLRGRSQNGARAGPSPTAARPGHRASTSRRRTRRPASPRAACRWRHGRGPGRPSSARSRSARSRPGRGSARASRPGRSD